MVARTRLIAEEADVERIAVLAEARIHGIAGVVLDHAQLRADGLLGQLLRSTTVIGGEIRIDDTHRKTQLERVGQTAPALQTAAVKPVGIGGDHACTVARKHLDGSIQISEHGLEDLFLRVQRHRIGARTHLRIGNRSVGVGDAVYAGDLHHLRHGDGILVFGHLAQLREVRHFIGVDNPVKYRRPVRLRVVGREFSSVESAVRIGDITAVRPAQQQIGELALIDVGRNDPALHGGHERPHGVTVPLHILCGNLIGIPVDIFVVGRAGCRAERCRRKGHRHIRYIEFHGVLA